MAYAYLAFFAGVSLTWVLDQCVYFLMYLSDKRRAAQHTASCELASLQGAVISPPTCCNDAQANTACSTCTELCSCGCRQPECCSSPSTPADARVHTCTCQAQVTQPAAALSTLSGDANPSGCTSCTGMLHVGCSATNILSTFQKQQASLPPSCPCLNHSSLQRSRAAKHMHVVTQAAHSRQCLPAQQRDIILQVQADQNVVTEAPTHAATEACNGDAVRPMLPVHGCMDSCMAGCSITRKVDASCMDLDQEAALLLKRMGE